MKTLSVLFINRVYPPGDGATGHLLADLAVELVRRGHCVTVVTTRSVPGAASSETLDGVRVERVNVMRFTRKNHWRRALGYLTMYPALLWRAFRLPRADVVVTMTDPPLLVVLAPVLKWARGCRLVHWAQDLYPEVAEELGVLKKGGCISSLCARLSTWALQRHDQIVAVGRCMKSRLVGRGLAEQSIQVVPNWTRHVRSIEHTANRFRHDHQLADRWVVMYSGNLGLAHPFDVMLDAAGLLAASHPDILFMIVGAGPRLAEVKRQAEVRALGNVRFLPPQAPEGLAQSLSAADLHLVSMLENLCGLVVPSKVYGILGAGRPGIFLGPRDCEAARVIEEFRCGTVLESAKGDTLARCISDWKSDEVCWREAGRRAQEVSRRFCLDACAPTFEKILVQAAEAGTALALQPTASSTQA